jgi:hypothetical protein
MDHLANQAKSLDLLESQKQYLRRLAAIVPGAYVRETPKDAGWFVAINNARYVKIDAFVSDSSRRRRWVDAIGEFQSAAMKRLQDD